MAKFTIHRTVGEQGGYFFNSFLPLPPVSETSSISWVTAAESSPLHIVSGWTRNSFERKSLTTKLRAVYISFKYQISSQAQNLVIMLKIHCKTSPQKCKWYICNIFHVSNLLSFFNGLLISMHLWNCNNTILNQFQF